MSASRWLRTFIIILAALALSLAAFNYAVDPFGAFGDKLLDWFSYDETINPRVAKISYLEEHGDEYDSYIIGCSSTSSFPVEELNSYTGGKFYNLIMYGADMLDVENEVRYLIENQTVKNLVVNVYIDNAELYDYEPDPLTYRMHALASGENLTAFYARYLFASPSWGFEKLKAKLGDTWLPQVFDVFDPVTGSYDKRARDAEPIGSMDSYLEAYPVFTNYPGGEHKMDEIESTMGSMERIVAMCEEANVDLTVVTAPVYCDYMAQYERAEVEEFYTALAEVTPYWDFAMSSVSYEPRYFYDDTHFRNSVGSMALARMFGNEEVYIPEDFGVYVTRENAAANVSRWWESESLPHTSYTARVPVLIYHHISEDGGDTDISASGFEAHMEALSAAGYTGVSVDELIAFVERGEPLPEKPVLITFDDGYLSNYTLAYPILQKYDMKATIFVIGVSVGREVYKDTDFAMTPHFSWEQAREMAASGLVSIQSHSYDLHEWPPFEPEGAAVRESVLALSTDKERDYLELLRADIERSVSEIEAGTGVRPTALAYPHGDWDIRAQAVIRSCGVPVTFGAEYGTNTVIKGLPQSLYAMNRIVVSDAVTPETLIAHLAALA